MEDVNTLMNKARKILIWTTGIILGFIIISSLVLTYNLIIIKYPEPPVINNTIPPTDQQKLVQNYKDLVAAIQFKRTNIFEYTVIKTLLELFRLIITSLIAFIFAQAGIKLYQTFRAEKREKQA